VTHSAHESSRTGLVARSRVPPVLGEPGFLALIQPFLTVFNLLE
jgi:hypothetical protein